MVETKKLKHFVILAEIGNFNDAAVVLHISQPALSRSIQSLEENLQLKLFDRSQRAIRLTPAGVDLLEYARKVLLDLENLGLKAGRLKSLQDGRLVVGTGPLPADHIGAMACARFMTLYPNVRLSLVVDHPDKIVPQLKAGEVDVLLADPRGIQDLTDLALQPLPCYPVVTIGRTGHPLAARKALAFEDIQPYPLASISQIATKTVEKALGLTRDESSNLFVFDCNTVQPLVTILKNSDAIGILLSCNVDAEIAAGDLCILDVPAINDQLRSEYGVVTFQPRLHSFAAEEFIRIVHGIAGS